MTEGTLIDHLDMLFLDWITTTVQYQIWTINSINLNKLWSE